MAVLALHSSAPSQVSVRLLSAARAGVRDHFVLCPQFDTRNYKSSPETSLSP